MSTNPYLAEIQDRVEAERATGLENVLEHCPTADLSLLAIAQELARMNDLTVCDRPVPEDGSNSSASGEDSDGDLRIAAAARRWAELYARRNETAAAAGYYLSCAELAEAVRQVDAR